MKSPIFILFPVLILVACLYSSAYVVIEGKQVIITAFGKPIKAVTHAGLKFKIPFIQQVRTVEKRILSWDGYPNQIPTKDKKYIHVDTTARWKIIDPLKFIQTVQNERGAKARLDANLDAITRDVISNHMLVETVRNSNAILNQIEERKKIVKNKNTIEEEITGEIEKIKIGREELSKMITEKADKELRQFGISIIDVQFRRISYQKSVERKVYDRMISERQRIAEKIRSVGKGEKAKIQGRLRKDMQAITSEAYKISQIIKGKAEAKAIKIYAKAFKRDPKFYEFTRKLEAYKKSIKEDTHLILSSDSEFLNLLK